MAMRQTMVDMVLATEMTKHFEHLNKFVGVIVNHKEDQPGSSSDVRACRLYTLSYFTGAENNIVK